MQEALAEVGSTAKTRPASDAAGAGTNGRVWRFVASEHEVFDRPDMDQLLGIDYR